MLSYANGKYIPTEAVSINVSNDVVGTLRGYRIFTACRTLNGGNVFRMEDHVERLFRSAQELSMELPHDREGLKDLVATVVEKNKHHGDVLLEIMYSGGKATLTGMAPQGPAHIYVLVFPFTPPPDDWNVKGISLASFAYQRQWPNVKLLNYVGGVVAHQTVVKDYGATEALFVSPRDCQTILEGTTFSLFAFDMNDTVITPPLNGTILDGVTRKVLLEILPRAGIAVEERRITLADLSNMNEVLLASSTRNIVPVVKVDNTVIGKGLPGPMVKRLNEILAEYQKTY
ncbi:MAG: aminotransferase class IV [Anaerolineales bacterium]|nr:aminotransferase class IV [Anaerolineales bacterium]